jgi:hypothetical protein
MFVDSPLATRALDAWSDHPGGYRVDASARVLYDKACRRATLSRIRALLRWHPPFLKALPPRGAGRVESSETLTVLIACIQGSENRPRDFDRHFRPVQGHTKERWISVAVARLLGHGLPPVELLEVGDDYYVRDGHHRISVARALGEQYIEAVVSVCGCEYQGPSDGVTRALAGTKRSDGLG